MTQAKGIMPRGEDREVLYRNPNMCGYFIGVTLDPAFDRAAADIWLQEINGFVDALVERDPAGGDREVGNKVASVAVGLAPSFFWRDGGVRFGTDLEPPSGFAAGPALAPQQIGPLADSSLRFVADVMFYVASVREDRVNAFITGVQATALVQTIRLERGYQRLDGTEPFGYEDGVRNAPGSGRSPVVFVHRNEREADEPAWADGGSYMAYLKIPQFPERFAALADDGQRDAVIGRQQDGTRLDMVGQDVEPGHEPDFVPVSLPPTSHVRKAGPRGTNDDVQIFRRGLPYMETTPEGELRVGLQFCSFQASLDQFDVVFNDWCLNPHFPQVPSGGDAGTDALLDPSRGLTGIESFGFFFVPPHQEAGLAAAVFCEPAPPRKPTTGQLVVHKRVHDQANTIRRFERRGFTFQVLDEQGQQVGSDFSTDGTGRAVYDGALGLGRTYTLHETFSPVQSVQLADTTFAMEKVNQQLQVENIVMQPETPYGSS